VSPRKEIEKYKIQYINIILRLWMSTINSKRAGSYQRGVIYNQKQRKQRAAWHNRVRRDMSISATHHRRYRLYRPLARSLFLSQSLLQATLLRSVQSQDTHGYWRWSIVSAEYLMSRVAYSSNFKFMFQRGRLSVPTTCLCPLYTTPNPRYQHHCNFYVSSIYTSARWV
jgi:hypothetical protein